MVHTVKGFGVVNKAGIDIFLELSCFFDDPVNVGYLTSGSSAFFKSSLSIWKFMVHIQLKPGLENFDHYFASIWDEWNCAVLWAFFICEIQYKVVIHGLCLQGASHEVKKWKRAYMLDMLIVCIKFIFSISYVLDSVLIIVSFNLDHSSWGWCFYLNFT